MRINAQQVIEEPETQVMMEVKRTGTMPPPPPPMQPDVPVLVLVVVPVTPVETAAAAPMEAAPTKLPKTGTPLPLIGLLGVLLMALGLGVKVVRTRNA
jgi:LPXTG-motif cell wall-anchored protein